MKKKKDILLP